MYESPEDKNRFFILHCVAAVIHLASACIITFVMSPVEKFNRRSLQFTGYEYKKDITLDPPATTIDRPIDVWKHVNPIFFVALNEWLTFGSHLFALIYVKAQGDRIEIRKEGHSRSCEYNRRWLEYAFTAGILEIGILVGQGETNMNLLIVVFFSNVALQMIGWFQDVNRDNTEVPSKIMLQVAGLILLGNVIFVLSEHAANQTGIEIAWPYLVVVFAIFYSSFGIHQTLYLFSKGYAKTFDIDQIYIALSISAKTVLSWTFVAIYRKTWADLGAPITEPVDLGWEKDDAKIWDVIMITFLVLAGLFLLWCYGKESIPKTGTSTVKQSLLKTDEESASGGDDDDGGEEMMYRRRKHVASYQRNYKYGNSIKY